MGSETGIGLTFKTKKAFYDLLSHNESADMGLMKLIKSYEKCKGGKHV